MRNDEVELAPRPVEVALEPDRGPEPGDPTDPKPAAPLPAPARPLLILATDEDNLCVDDLCLPAEARG